MDTTHPKEGEDVTKKLEQLTAENKKLRQAVDKLSMLNDLSLSISGTVERDKIMNTIIDRSICFIGAEQGNITLFNDSEDADGEILVRSTCSTKSQLPLYSEKELLHWMRYNQKPIRLNDPHSNTDFDQMQWSDNVHSILSVPLKFRSRLIGVLTIYNKKGSQNFTEKDQQLLSIISSQSAQVIENARLYQEERNLQEMRRKVEVANKIQEQLLPRESPDLKHYNLAGKNVTAQTIGGDYYDFIQLDEYRWAVCLGDVSGKGLPASLLMSNLQALIRGEIPCEISPSALLESVNNKLYSNTDIEKYATLFVGILDTNSHTLTYSNAGHEHPFLLHFDGSYERLKTGGIPVGMMNDQIFEQETIEIGKGDKLAIFSDGIIDNRNQNNEEFGEERFKNLLEKKYETTGEQLLKEIFDISLKFSGESKLFDDMTAVVLARNLKG